MFELSTQLEERTKQMNEYKVQLEDERNWRRRASDLLSTSYEEDILELSKLCEKSVLEARHNAETITTLNNNLVMNKVMEYGKN